MYQNHGNGTATPDDVCVLAEGRSFRLLLESIQSHGSSSKCILNTVAVLLRVFGSFILFWLIAVCDIFAPRATEY